MRKIRNIFITLIIFLISIFVSLPSVEAKDLTCIVNHTIYNDLFGAHVYASATELSEIIGRVKGGTVLPVLAYNDNWALIQAPDVTGYMLTKDCPIYRNEIYLPLLYLKGEEMPIIERTKRIKAEDIAASLFEWDYEAVSDDQLYSALEEQGYSWDGLEWVEEEDYSNINLQ